MSDALDDKNGEGLDWSLPARLRRVATTLGDAMHNEAADRIEQLERELAQAKRDIEFDKNREALAKTCAELAEHFEKCMDGSPTHTTLIERCIIAAALRAYTPSADQRREGWPADLSSSIAAAPEFRADVSFGNVGHAAGTAAKIATAYFRSHEGSIPYIDRSEAVNLARNVVPSAPDYRPGEHQITPKGIRCLAEAVLKMDEAIRCAGSAKQHAVGFEKWMSYQLYYEQNTGSFKTDSQRYYTADQMRAAWEAGATGNLEEVARYFETRYAHVNDSKWIAKEIRDLMRSPERMVKDA